MLSQGFVNIWAALAVPVQNGSAQIIAALMAYIGPLFQAAAFAWMLIRLVIQFYEPNANTVQDFLKQMGMAAAVFTLVSVPGEFNYYVTALANGTTGAITNAIAGVFGQGGQVTAASFDQLADKSYSLSVAIMKNVPWYSFKSIPLGIGVMAYNIVTSIAISAIFLAFLIVNVSMSFIIAFGPMFIACIFFPYTRRFFDGWVQALVTAMLSQIFIIALLTLFIVVLLNALGDFAVNLDNGVDIGMLTAAFRNMFVAAAMAILFCLLTWFALKLAASIGGSVGMSMPRIPVREATRAVVSAVSNGSGAAGARGATGPAGAPGPAGSSGGGPTRQYAFNRTVGSAP
jgi:type IV secretion system protein VirB6